MEKNNLLMNLIFHSYTSKFGFTLWTKIKFILEFEIKMAVDGCIDKG